MSTTRFHVINKLSKCIFHFIWLCKFQITVKYAGIERSRIIHDKQEQNVVKAIFNLKPERALKYQKKAVVKQTCKEIKKELRNLLKKGENLFRVAASKEQIPVDLCEFEWAAIAEDFQRKAPILFEILQTVLHTKGKHVTSSSSRISLGCGLFYTSLYFKGGTMLAPKDIEVSSCWSSLVMLGKSKSLLHVQIIKN